MIEDAQGLPISGATQAAAAHYDQAVRAFNLGYGDAIARFDAARDAAPDFIMAHLGKAWLFALATDPGAIERARSLVTAARTLPMDDRERVHLAALEHALAGAPTTAVSLLDRHLLRHPLDILAHEVAFLLDLFLGRARLLRDRPARALPLWPKELSGYGTLLAFHAFGLEETGAYERAEDTARAAAELEPLSFWPHHAVAHVMEMTGRPEDGLDWMNGRETSWSTPEHATQTHIWWHKALFHIELGQHDAALAIYDGPIRDTQRPLGVSLTNASALLWRLDTLGCDVAARWRDLAALWEGHADGRCGVFPDMHAAMAELRSGNEPLAERRLGWMRETAARGDEMASCYREVGVPLVEGLLAFHRGDHDRAVELLHAVRFEIWRIGGSHAQRDIVGWTLMEAALRGGLRDVARGMAYERLGTRPRSAVNRHFLRRAEGIAA